jgi:hypothetical protein
MGVLLLKIVLKSEAVRRDDRNRHVVVSRLWPSLLGAAQVVQPETILR